MTPDLLPDGPPGDRNAEKSQRYEDIRRQLRSLLLELDDLGATLVAIHLGQAIESMDEPLP